MEQRSRKNCREEKCDKSACFYVEPDDHNPPGEGNIDWQELDALLDTLPRLYHAETESGIWDKKSWQAFCSVLGKHSAD